VIGAGLSVVVEMLPEGGREAGCDGAEECGDGSREVVGTLLEGGRESPLPSAEGLLDASALFGSNVSCR
jgi:hypothetical protein